MEENSVGTNRTEIEISAKDLLSILVKRLWIIIICAILCGIVTYIYNKNSVTPIYRSEIMFCIAPVGQLDSDYTEYAKLQLEYQSMLYAKQIINTYIQIFKTNTFKTKLAEDYYENYGKHINGSVSASEIVDTELFKISVLSTSKDDAYEIAKQIEKTAPEIIVEIKDTDSIRIVDKALKPEFPINNNTNRNTLIGIMFGAMLAYGVSFLIFVFDRRIKGEEDLKNHYNVPILGGIVDFDSIPKDKRKQY